MIDFYEAQRIVKQAKQESEKEFEKNYPIVAEFLSKKIEEQSKLARTNISIYIKDILEQFPAIEDIDEVVKYLIFKGFYVEKISEKLGASHGKIKEIKPYLSISWH